MFFFWFFFKLYILSQAALLLFLCATVVCAGNVSWVFAFVVHLRACVFCVRLPQTAGSELFFLASV